MRSKVNARISVPHFETRHNAPNFYALRDEVAMYMKPRDFPPGLGLKQLFSYFSFSSNRSKSRQKI